MIAVIPARGGSKGLPGKNIKEIQGKPLIAYTIEAAKQSKSIEKVIVTTDSQEIAEVAIEFGAEVPFLRPEYLAGDTASAIDVYIHAAEYMVRNQLADMSKFMVLLPTAPLRDSKDIDNAIELFYREEADTLISTTEAETPPAWYYYQDINGRIHNAGFDLKNIVANRQNSEQYYIPNGAIYILDYQLLKEKRTYYSENTIPYTMPIEKSVDIDTLFDFEFVKFLMEKRES